MHAQAAASLPLFSFVGAQLAYGRQGHTYRARPLRASKSFKMRSSKAPKSCTILVQITPLESALTDTDPVSPAECALAKNRGEGVHTKQLRHSRSRILYSPVNPCSSPKTA